MRIPTDYLARHEAARATNPAMVDNYIAHTIIGDPLADAALAAMADMDPHESHRFVEAGLEST